MRPVPDNPYWQHLEPHAPILFNLSKDPNETTNLIKDLPEKAWELEQRRLAFERPSLTVPEPKLKAVPFDDLETNNPGD
jgi:hypothetical protein